MSDILEDKQIHFIVKDYRRMYNGFHTLVEENKELRKQVETLEKKVVKLQSEVDKKEKVEVKKILDGAAKCMLNDSLSQVNSLYNKAKQFIEQTERLSKRIEELDKELRK